MFWHRNVDIQEAEVGLLYENGRYQRLLYPGRHRLTNSPWRHEQVTRVDMRRASFVLNGQEMLTADALSVRLSEIIVHHSIRQIMVQTGRLSPPPSFSPSTLFFYRNVARTMAPKSHETYPESPA